jgi:hypothetical protein
LYSYSKPNNQVTIEQLDPRVTQSEEIAFITRLDDYYRTLPGTDNAYRLMLVDSTARSLPDSMEVVLAQDASGNPRLDFLEYFDINEDLNRIVFKSQTFAKECDSAGFEPNFPDSVEVIRLY